MRRGELWALGRHRLICGDAGSAGDRARLLDGGKPDFILTDPPYGIGMSTGITDPGLRSYGAAPERFREYGGEAWDEERPPREVFEALLAYKRPCFVFGGNFFTDLLPVGTSWIVWDKTGERGFRNPFSSVELIWTNLRRKTSRKVIYIQQGFCCEEKREARFHPTQKPTTLLARILGEYAPEGGVVLDPFAGAGGTLLACERTGRAARVMEIDPAYCETIIRRWEDATGRKAERMGQDG